MNLSFSIRPMHPLDLEAANDLRALAGWNQTRADWARLLAWEPGGCFLAEHGGQTLGTITTTIYSLQLAWIGMLLVHPRWRRRGIGRALLERALGYLEAREVRGIKLDATPEGENLYREFGFQPEWALSRWQREKTSGRAPAPIASGFAVRPLEPGRLDELADLDAAAFGLARGPKLWSLADQALAARLALEGPTLVGFGWLRPGARADYLGPVVARSLEVGQALVSQLAACASKEIFWDVPESNAGAVQMAAQLGFTRRRMLWRMFLGTNRHPGDPQLIYAIADPAIG